MEEKFTARIKVMRSYDYCHFEAELGSQEPMTIDQVNEMRKKAALLVDEAVRQYKVAKQKESNRQVREWEAEQLLNRTKRIQQKPENEWTVEEAALMRGQADKEFWDSYHEEDYYYADSPERDHHFSMLRRFKETVVKA